MITIKDIICIPLSEAEIKSVMHKAREHLFISKRDNLRTRHANIQFDCIMRGYIGEYAIAKWLNEYDIVFDNINFKNDGDDMDIDFLYKGKNIELKTSLIPDIDATLSVSIAKRDIKLIKRGEHIADLKGDIHLQVFFDQRRKAKDLWLKGIVADIDHASIDELYTLLLARCYRNSIYFVGWADKTFITDKINQTHINLRTWTFKDASRNFWNCKIAESFKPADLPNYLLNI